MASQPIRPITTRRAIAITITTTLLLAVAAAPAAPAKSRLLAEPNGTVTIQWPDRVCSSADEDGSISYDTEVHSPDLQNRPEGVDAEPDAAATDDEGSVRDDPDADTDVSGWPTFQLEPWRVVYKVSGSYEAWYDWTCAVGNVQIEPVDPDAHTVMRAARASHRAKVGAARTQARRRGVRR
jgi:hypothetical protein